MDQVVLKFRHYGMPVEITGMNKVVQTLMDRLAVHDKPRPALAADGP